MLWFKQTHELPRAAPASPDRRRYKASRAQGGETHWINDIITRIDSFADVIGMPVLWSHQGLGQLLMSCRPTLTERWLFLAEMLHGIAVLTAFEHMVYIGKIVL